MLNVSVVVQDIKDVPFQELLGCEAIKSLAAIQHFGAWRCLSVSSGMALSKQLCVKTSVRQICKVEIASVGVSLCFSCITASGLSLNS